jgi:hypothetical protein
MEWYLVKPRANFTFTFIVLLQFALSLYCALKIHKGGMLSNGMTLNTEFHENLSLGPNIMVRKIHTSTDMKK